MSVPRPDPRRWQALAVLAVMQFLIVTDNTIVNVALPAIRHDLAFSNGGLAWVVDGYVLAAGGLLLLGGRIGDRLGHRRLFLIGTCVCGLASLASGASLDAGMLVVSRFGQGVGEALAAPAALALIAVLFTGDERGKALGVWGGLAGIGATVGVLLSGVLVEWASWRWIFLINVPFVLAAIVAVPHTVPADARRSARERLDVPGALLVTGGLTLLVAALLHTAGNGWTSGGTLVLAAAGLACLVVFVVVEHRVAADPLVPLHFLRHRTRVGANLMSLLLGAAMAGMFVLLTLYQQLVLGWSALHTGLAYLPFCLAFAPGFAIAAALLRRFGTRTTLVTAFTTCAAGMLLLARLGVGGDYAGTLLPAMLVLAVGLGMAFPATQTAALSDVDERSSGLASGLQTTAQAVGAAVGVALLVAVAADHAGHRDAPGLVHGYRIAFLLAAGLYAAAAVLAAWCVREREAVRRDDDLGVAAVVAAPVGASPVTWPGGPGER